MPCLPAFRPCVACGLCKCAFLVLPAVGRHPWDVDVRGHLLPAPPLHHPNDHGGWAWPGSGLVTAGSTAAQAMCVLKLSLPQCIFCSRLLLTGDGRHHRGASDRGAPGRRPAANGCEPPGCCWPAAHWGRGAVLLEHVPVCMLPGCLMILHLSSVATACGNPELRLRHDIPPCLARSNP